MSWIMDRVGGAAAMREMDRKAIEEFNVPGLILMENAGRGAFEFLVEEFEPRRVAVFAGKGNNGGDGYVIARHLINAGIGADVYLLARKEDVTGDARQNLDALVGMGGQVHQIQDEGALEDSRFRVLRADLIVDAILGTGIDSEVRGLFRDAIGLINNLVQENPRIRVFAVDLPSGLNADTGQVMGAAIRADATATFAMIKTGLLSFPGARLAGSLAVIDISLPRQLYGEAPHRLVTAEAANAMLPARDEDCHKGAAGHGLVLAGSPGKTGAAVMAAESGLRAGAGLITLAAPAGLHQILETKTLEVMTEPLPETDVGLLGEDAAERALELLAAKTAAALGPGLGHGDSVTGFVRKIIAEFDGPIVIDADGINAVAEDPEMLDASKGPVIITPHPGEMARLIGSDTSSVLADRLTVALDFAKKYNSIVVLKGAHTITACPDGGAFFNPSGNPGMATGGTGDVLTGVILGLLCQGLSPADAAVLGVFLHGLAGDLAAEKLGEEATIAGDLMDRLPDAFIALREAGGEEE